MNISAMSCVSPGTRYFVGDICNVFDDVLPHTRCGVLALVLVRRVAPGGHRFQRKLGVDDQRSRIRHEDRAIRPRLVLQRELEFVGSLRQPVGDDRLHSPLAEGAARLLVGEHVLQRAHLRRQLGDVLLRAVDNGQPRMQLSAGVRWCAWSSFHRLAEVLRHRVEPLVHVLLQLGLRARQHLAHRLHRGRKFGDACLRGGVHHRRLRPQQQHDDGNDAGCDGECEDKKDLRHAAVLA